MAVLTSPTTLLLATDVVVEGVHFDRRFGSLADAGWKALATNLSDVAAMGGSPLGAVVGVVGASRADLDELYDGILSCAARYDCPIVGGDLTDGAQLVVSIAVAADAVVDRPVLRSGGRPGDVVFVTNPLGSSAAGLRLLKADEAATGDCVEAYRRPLPRLEEGRAARRAGASAMIDVSDGLALDLDRLCRASGVGVVLEDLPVADGATATEAMGGGDDYELCSRPGHRRGALGVLLCRARRAAPDRGARRGRDEKGAEGEGLRGDRLHPRHVMSRHVEGGYFFVKYGRSSQTTRRGGFCTLPARMHDVQTLIRFGEPATSARTRWMFGSQRRFVRRCEWKRSFRSSASCRIPHIPLP